ncbi:type II protein arginine methyltransferase Ecym_5485 [Eremothecium cymbalariae DBVPG|uniref:type II protein arginine methyltransferase n=1 Tax=Eremothecium cymbalariae (strain CBS 270.75 / DBVPG 7215 / KCTC 17166 / NRRL Y-17582) TaxID=931890 RepID=I6NDT8_ERECY|nr:hypothetical protein Ecym_5485 [Eremothecium cymbalariae DBVPG\
MKQYLRRFGIQARLPPLLNTKQLLEVSSLTSFTVCYRDLMEWNNVKIAHRGKFFNPHMQDPLTRLHSIHRFESLVSHSLARWMHVDYKLNSYPYHDLNIMIIYMDINQALRSGEMLVDYLDQVDLQLTGRVHCNLMQLYESIQPHRSKIAQKVKHPRLKVLNRGILLSNSEQYFTEGPVYVILMNGVLSYLSCDLIKMDENHGWQQMYVDVDVLQNHKSVSFGDPDDLCRVAADICIPNHLHFPSGSEMFIPSRMIQFFHNLSRTMSEHKLFALDIPQTRPWWHKLWSNEQKHASRFIQKYQFHNIFEKSEVETLFIPDFAQVKTLYNHINQGMNLAQVNSLVDFTNEWMDLKESASFLNRDISLEYQYLQDSKLEILRST